MRALLLALVFVAALSGGACADEERAWGDTFARRGVTGTFVLKDLSSGTTRVWNAQRAAERLFPASTYKIVNALIALDSKAVSGPDDVIPWDGVQRGIAAWNRNHTLRSGFAVSAVWAFEELARREGPATIAKALHAARYGNADSGDGTTAFWLHGPLRISALEQVDFLARLYRGDLPFSPATIDTVKDIMVAERGDGCVLRAKSGWTRSPRPEVGWWVGLIERPGSAYAFALNMDIASPKDAAARVEIGRKILKGEGLLP